MSIINEFMAVLGKPMVLFGIFGQVLFSLRFLIQWIASEKKKESIIPIAFWYFSIVGASLVLIYAVWRRDPVFTVAQCFGLAVYARNLHLIHRKQTAMRSGRPASPTGSAPGAGERQHDTAKDAQPG